jgi:hypothetical protein
LKLAELDLDEGSAAAAEAQARALLSGPEKGRDPGLSALLTALVAHCRLMAHAPREARELSQQAMRLAEQDAGIQARQIAALIAGEAEAAAGDCKAARAGLTQLLDEATRKQLFDVRLEARLALGRIAAGCGDRAGARKQLEAVARDARAAGFRRVARVAAAAAAAAP